MRFYLGTHQPNWLRTVNVPLFVSRRTLTRYKTLPKAIAPWALDSGGFTELSMHGQWTISPEHYASEVARFTEIEQMQWAAPQDWMCEPFIVAKTGLSVAEHQRRTVENFLRLRRLSAPVIPVLQGWGIGDYERCLRLYESEGVCLRDEPVVGLGSVCRRQHTDEANKIIQFLAGAGLRLHGFGLKMAAVERSSHLLASADSMAWSFGARHLQRPTCGSLTHKNCANCPSYALAWRERLLDKIRIDKNTRSR